MKEQDQKIRSVADGARRIREAYKLFADFIQPIKTLQSRRVKGSTIASLAANPVEKDFELQAKRSKVFRDNARVNFAASFKRLRELHGRLPEAFAPVFPMLKHSLRPLGKFHFEGDEGVHAFWFIDQLFLWAEAWALITENILSVDLEIPIDPRVRDRLSEIEDSLPLSLDSEKALRDRIALEESQLLRDLPDYAKISGVKESKPETLIEIVEAIKRSRFFACLPT